MTLKTATATININALVNNFHFIKKRAPQSKVLAVLKANAYGHGLERIAQRLSQPDCQADAFGVARIDEALALRAAGIIKPIVLLEGFFDVNDLELLAVNNFQTIIHNEEQLTAICSEELSLVRPLKVWLKIDTGMHRLGITPDDFARYYRKLKACSNIDDAIVLMSHLGCADEDNNALTHSQISLFNEITKDLKDERSLANSAGVQAWDASHYDWVRPGLLLYGVSPMKNGCLQKRTIMPSFDIRPVMTLQASLIAVRKLAKGEFVGYGAAWQSSEETMIGVIAIGYGDGYPRHAKNGTPVVINGRRVQLVGRVSMDMITIDLGLNCPDKVGDIATLWGEELSVEEVAQWSTTIPYELLCNITRRVQVVTVS